MCTTRPRCSPSISSNRCSARARSCAAPYGVGPRRAAHPQAGGGLRDGRLSLRFLEFRRRHLFHVQLEPRHPANRFTQAVGMAFAAMHDVLIAHELAAVDPAEAMLIGGLAVGGTCPS